MDPIFEGFKKAYEEGNGYDLSMTLSPVDPHDEPDRLYKFFRSTNFAQVKKDFQYRILYDSATPFKLPAEEGSGWVEVYLAYWKAVGEVLNAEHAPKANAKVRIHSGIISSLFSMNPLVEGICIPFPLLILGHVISKFRRQVRK
jgi:hypothetical protein